MLKIFFIIFLGAVSITAQDIPSVSSGEIQFYVDWYSFKGNNNKTIQELSYMTFTDQFKEGSDTIAIDVNVKAKDIKNKTVLNKAWTTYAIVSEDSLRALMNIVDEFRTELPPGNYRFEVTLTDPYTEKSGLAKFDIEIPDLADAPVSTIKFTSSDNKSTPGEAKIRANPSRRYGLLNPIVSVFYEIYSWSNASGKLQIRYSIVNDEKEVIKKLPSASVENKRSDMAISHGFDVSNVPSGIYDLQIQITDNAGKEIALSSRPFEVIQYDYANRKTLITDDEAELSGRLIKIISPSQHQAYQKLNLQGKAEFLLRFWKKYDPSPDTPENEFLTRIQQRYHYANQNFGWGKEQGWESDRGRVLIQYGNPDEVSAHHNESETAPYEIWYYTEDRNYLFVFADMQSNGHFVLVHSNKEGEVRNSYWKNSLQK